MVVSLSILTEFQHTSEGIVLASGTQENLRAGMNYIVRDLVLTGVGLPTGGIPIPSGAGVPVNRPGPAGANYTFPITYTVLPAITPGAGMGANVLEPGDMVWSCADNSIQLNQNI